MYSVYYFFSIFLTNKEGRVKGWCGHQPLKEELIEGPSRSSLGAFL